MHHIIAYAATFAFGLFVAWLCELWIGLFDDRVFACLFGFALLCVIGFIVDRRQDRMRRSNTETTELQK